MRKQGSFTLIEIIVSLVLVGTMSAIAGMAIVTAMKGYVFSKDNATLSEKAQLALARINRELIEIIDVTSAESSRITYTRMSGDNLVAQTIYRSDNKIKIVTGANASGGDDLIDSVNNLTFAYFKGSASWVAGTDDINLLSAIQVTLVLARSDGGANLTFATTASPRNNQNTGGVPPTTTPPARVGYGCFVATAAFGDIHHPMV
jgi:type II secretory pathway pseudopilin PulG